MRNLIAVLFIASLAGLAVVALGATCQGTRSTGPGSDFGSVPDVEGAPTVEPGPAIEVEHPSFGGVADSVQEAADFARTELTMRPPYVLAETERLKFVVTTVGEARALVGMAREDNLNIDVADREPAVVFIAEGRFRVVMNRFADSPPPIISTVWIVVPLGVTGTFSGAGSGDYDLSSLGEVRDVVVPLPEFPAPVDLVTAD